MFILTILAVASLATSGLTLEVTPAGKFPESFAFAQAHYDGNENVYVIGGVKNSPDDSWNFSSSIWKYNVVTGENVKVGEFPSGVAFGSIGSSPTIPDKFFYVGGRTDTTFASSDIHSVNLANSQIEKVGSLPHGLNAATSVSDGHGSMYIFGGRDPNTRSIQQFDIENNVVISYGGLLENFTDGMAGWVDGSAYIIGGAYYSKHIYKFTPKPNKAGTVELLPVELPNPQHSSGSVVVGHNIYLVGGQGYGRPFRLTRFNTQTHEIHTEHLTVLPSSLYGIATVYVEKLNRIYLFGGYYVHSFITLPLPYITYIQL